MGADYEKSHRSIIGGFTATNIGANLTRYAFPYGSPPLVPEIDARMVMPFSCILTRYWVRSTLAPGAGETYDITVLLNGVPTLLTLQIAGAVDVQAGPDVDMVAITADDELSIEVVTSLNAALCQMSWSMEVRH